MYPTTLVGTVDIRLALSHHRAIFIRSVDILTAGSHLPSLFYTTCWPHDIIVPVILIEFGALTGIVAILIAIKDDHGIADGSCTISRQFSDHQHRVDVLSTGGIGIDEITAAVFIPQRTTVDQSFPGNDEHRVIPTACRILCLDHIDTMVGVSPVDIKLTLVITDAGCPYALSVTRSLEMSLHLLVTTIERLQGITDNLPVDQVFRM